MKKAKFQTLAEAIEAGEPLIADKITGELKLQGAYLDIGEILKVDKAYKTLSGAFVILARHRTPEELTEKQKRHKKIIDAIENEERENIKAALCLPGYILIGCYWCQETGLTERGNAYYIPVTGSRYVYSRQCKTVYKERENKTKYKTAEPERGKLSRWSRKEIAELIKSNVDKCTLYAPLWLLTSTPDPRPRFLDGKE